MRVFGLRQLAHQFDFLTVHMLKAEADTERQQSKIIQQPQKKYTVTNRIQINSWCETTTIPSQNCSHLCNSYSMPVPVLFCKISGPSFSYLIYLNVNNISLIVPYFFSKNTDLIKYFPVLLETKKHSYLY